MISKITQFFQRLHDDALQDDNDISIEIACAVLLCEVMRADGQLDTSEQETMSALLSSQFSLSSDEVEAIISQAISLSEHATDFYQFTSKINEHFSIEERVAMVEQLWQLANADGKICHIEEHIIRKIADLLHLRHSEYIQTKLAVQK